MDMCGARSKIDVYSVKFGTNCEEFTPEDYSYVDERFIKHVEDSSLEELNESPTPTVPWPTPVVSEISGDF